MLVADSYPFLEIVGTILVFFAWVLWIWTVVAILSDVFRRDDLSGWGKAGWTLAVIVVPFLGMVIYLVAHGKGMAERNAQEGQRREAAFQGYVRNAGGSDAGSAAEIERAKKLLDAGAIDQSEYDELKRKALAT